MAWILRHQRQSQSFVSKRCSVGHRAVLDRTAEEALKLPHVGMARMRERYFGGADVVAHQFAHAFQADGESKFGALGSLMTRKADKFELYHDPALVSQRFTRTASLTIRQWRA
jgi:hypothetical protein